MKMTLRWFGEKNDSVTLAQIRQIPGVEGIIGTLYETLPGDEWEMDEILALKKKVEDAGLSLLGIESVNVHDEIKMAGPNRDLYITHYINTLEKLGKAGINMVCYNFMPVFDWTRSDLAKVREDGSTVLAYDQSKVDAIDPTAIFEQIGADTNGFIMPGWEPERMSRVKELFELYKDIDDKALFENWVYFMSALMPVCEKYDINMAIHIDDPVWNVYGLPRIVKNYNDIKRLLDAVPNKHNGLTLCVGSLSSDPTNDIPAMIRAFGDRIHFAHIRNTKHTAPGVFEEACHLSRDGSVDMVAVMQAFVDIGFTGPARPDHGRAIWGEIAMPGYGLYDRALGSQYLLGLYDAIIAQKNK